MKIGLLLAGVSCALSVSDELKELVNFDEWAHEALAEAPISGKHAKMVSQNYGGIFHSSKK